VKDVGGWEGMVWRWRLQWRRDRFEWEAEMEGKLMECITKVPMKRDSNDTFEWGDEAFEKYTVNSTYGKPNQANERLEAGCL